MKKFVFIIQLILILSMSFGQRKEVNNAYNHYSNQYWDRAKMAIDKAITHDETKNDAKTWLYRGNIYLQLGYAKLDPNMKRYHGLCDNCGEIAYDAYRKAFELDPNIEIPSMGISKPATGMTYCTDLLYNDAVEQLKTNNFEKALVYAEKCYRSNTSSESANYIYALSAEYMDKKDIAKERYRAMIFKKQPTLSIDPYVRLASIYRDENDTNNALKVVMALPGNDTITNIDYVINKAVILSWAGKTDEATATMDVALAKDPENFLLLYGLGTVFSDQKKYEEAEKYLLKAYELKPDDINVVYNLGNSHYNHYAEIFNSLDDIEDNDEYNKAKDESQVLLRKALPFLEKAKELDPTDRNTLIMLKTIYPRLEAKEDEIEEFKTKLQEVNELFEKVN